MENFADVVFKHVLKQNFTAYGNRKYRYTVGTNNRYVSKDAKKLNSITPTWYLIEVFND